LGYKQGSPERFLLQNKINEMKQNVVEIPLVIGGKEVRTGNIGTNIPHLFATNILKEKFVSRISILTF
jgi:1-pyrroline-5-carboxylate dehydrogenase